MGALKWLLEGAYEVVMYLAIIVEHRDCLVLYWGVFFVGFFAFAID